MWGLIGSSYVLEHPNDFEAMVLSWPAIESPDNAIITEINKFLTKFISPMFPRVKLTKLDVNWISSIPEVINDYMNDILVYKGRITMKLCNEILKTIKHVKEHANKIRLKTLILQGKKDTLVNPEGAKILHDLIENSELKTYKWKHEVFNDVESKQVLQDMTKFIEKVLNIIPASTEYGFN
jgi:alpha-beta hydrolase superfamily lysophospholipase